MTNGSRRPSDRRIGLITEPGLGDRVVRGARWVALSRIVTMATTWVTTIVLARFLAPSEYGLAGMAMVVVAFFTVFQDSGLHAALVQRRGRAQEAIDTAAVYAPILGLVLLVLCIVGAPLAGLFFHNDEVTDLVRALGFVFLLRSFAQVPRAVLEKELMFGRVTAVQLSGTLLQTAAVISLAARGAGAWSVIVGQLVLTGWAALLLWPICPVRPHPRRASVNQLRQLWGYGRHMVVANISGFVNSQVDVLVVGRKLGASELGAYTLGFTTGRQAVAAVTYATNQVIFPAYAQLQDDLERFRRAYLRSLRFICVISMPAGFGLAAVSSEFVRTIYGERWTPAIPVLAIVSLMGVVLSITSTMGQVFKATGRPRLLSRLSLLQTTLVVVSVISFYRFGIAAVAAAQALSVTITGLMATIFTARILKIDWPEWLQTILPSLLAASVMAAGIIATKLALGTVTSTATLSILVLLIIEGAVLFVVVLWLLAREQLLEFIKELERLGAMRAARERLTSRRRVPESEAERSELRRPPTNL